MTLKFTSLRLTACALLLLFASLGATAQQIRVLPRGTPLSLVTVDGCSFEWNSNFVAMKEARAFKSAEANQCVSGLATGFWVVGLQALSYRPDYAPLSFDFVLAARFVEGKAVGMQMWFLENGIHLAHVRGEERIGTAFQKSSIPDTSAPQEVLQAIDAMAAQTIVATEGAHIRFLKSLVGTWLNDPAGMRNMLIVPYRDTPWNRGGSASTGTGTQPGTRQQDDDKTVGRGARGG